MYELVCKSSQERKDWIELLRKAVDESPEEGEGSIILLNNLRIHNT